MGKQELCTLMEPYLLTILSFKHPGAKCKDA